MFSPNLDDLQPLETRMSSPLTVIRAAVRGEYGGIHSVPIPGRHHDVIRIMREAGYTGSVRDQGFLLSDGRFVFRKTALEVAVLSGQVKRNKCLANRLLSEDVW